MSSPSVPLAELHTYLDSYLKVREVPDDANALNGLQVENRGAVARVVGAVDASQVTIDGLGKASASGPTLLLVHHGLFWDGSQPLTGRRYRRIRGLLDQDAALYSAHIPLDVHPEIGNNALLARQLGLIDTEPFGNHKGVLIGAVGRAPPSCRTRENLRSAIAATLSVDESGIRLIPGGPEQVSRIGVITGGAGSAIGQARDAGCDAFITGEGAAHTYFDAMELGMNVFYAGHYATETVGVRALAEHLGTRFNLPWEFHDHPTGM